MKLKKKITVPLTKAFYDVERDGLTQGLLQMWKDCRERARLFLQGWSKKEASMGLTYGSILHGVLEKGYKAISGGILKTIPNQKQVLVWIRMTEQEWERDNPRADKKAIEFKELACLIAEATIPFYFEYWRKDFKDFRWLALEKGFNLPYALPDGRKTLLRGKMDGVYRSPKLWLFETKTKSRINEGTLLDILPQDFQVLFYYSALHKIYKEIPAGVKYNIVRRIQLEQRKKESLREFAKRCVEDIQKRPEFYFIRYEIALDKQDMEKFEKELANQIWDFYYWLKNPLTCHYKNPGQCETKYGQCNMLSLCAVQRPHLYEKRKTVFRELEDF